MPKADGQSEAQMPTERVVFDESSSMAHLIGQGGAHLKTIGSQLAIKAHARGTAITLIGPPERALLARRLLEQLYSLVQRGTILDSGDIERAAQAMLVDERADIRPVFSDQLLDTGQVHIRPKSIVQKQYVDAIRTHDIVFGIGPAGTGKTYLAMAMAVAALLKNEVKRIIMTRPAVEAGERLGFLPGDLSEKVNPYLRPLYDAINDMLDGDRVQNMIERGQIEVAPLAFMRGRTLNGSFVVLDEAQNTTREQMMMFLTRLGFDSQAVVTGDITQVDLPAGATSGLVDAEEVLRDIKGVSFVRFTHGDVVRHPLVQQIILAYERRAQK